MAHAPTTSILREAKNSVLSLLNIAVIPTTTHCNMGQRFNPHTGELDYISLENKKELPKQVAKNLSITEDTPFGKIVIKNIRYLSGVIIETPYRGYLASILTNEEMATLRKELLSNVGVLNTDLGIMGGYATELPGTGTTHYCFCIHNTSSVVNVGKYDFYIIIFMVNDNDIYVEYENKGILLNNDKGVAGGVATLGNDGKVPSEQLPDITIGTTEMVTPITYSELKALRDNSQLVAGMQYRITDYHCTAIQEKTISRGHRFDIIVLAISENTLSEDAKAIKHVFTEDELAALDEYKAELEQHYFDNSNLEAWELKYCLDNDTTRFAWADSGIIYHPEYKYGIDSKGREWHKTNEFLAFNEGEVWYKSGENLYILLSREIQVTENSQGYQIKESINGETPQNISPDEYAVIVEVIVPSETTEGGKGVVYYMKDDFNNECPYDFKNIAVDVGYGYYIYTFGFEETDGSIDGCKNNTIKPFYVEGIMKIPIINIGYGCCDNLFEKGCHNNKLGDGCNGNVFGAGCNSICMGHSCSYNKFGNGCRNVYFYNDEWTYTSYCRYNTIESGVQSFIIRNIQTASENSQLQYYHFHEGITDKEMTTLREKTTSSDIYMTENYTEILT